MATSRVLFITRKWPPAVGGMEIYCRELVCELRYLIDVDLRALPGQEDGHPPSIRALGWFGFVTFFDLLLRGAPVDVVHVGDLAIWPLAYIVALRKRNIGQVLSAHGTDIALAHRQGFAASIYRSYIKLAAVALPHAIVLANSSATASLCIVSGFRSVRVVPLAAKLRDNIPTKSEPYVLFTGRLTQQKGCGWFIDRVLPLLDSEYRLVVAGSVWDAGEKRALRHFRVAFRGPVSGDDLADLRARATAIVVPNLDMGSNGFEGFGLAALEGAADGGVVLASDVYGLAESVREGQTGFLLPAGDAERWAEKIREVAAWSEPQRKAYIERSREVISEYYCWSRVAQQTVEAYSNSTAVTGARAPRLRILERTVDWLKELRLRLAPYQAKAKHIALFLSLCAFCAGLAWALVSVPGIWSRISLIPLAALFFGGVPSTVMFNALEFQTMMQAAGRLVSLRTAIQVSVYASAANMLPVPGGVITRLGAMRIRGISLKQSSILNLLFAGFWAGFAVIVSGFGITLHNSALGVEFVIPGILIVILSATALRLQHVSSGLITRMALIRAALLAIEATRMMLAVQALGMKLPFSGAATFAISSVAGSAVSLVPAGMGIREGVVALLSPIIRLDPAVGFLSAAIDRTMTMACLAALAVLLLLFSGGPFRGYQIGRKRTKPSSLT